MGYFFDTFWFEPGSRMTGIFTAEDRMDTSVELVAFAHKIELGADQDGSVESDFLQSHLPFGCGGFHGVGPDGHPWAVFLQVAPVSAAALVGSANPFWPAVDGMDRALHYNWEAGSRLEQGWTREDLLDVYAEQGVDRAAVEDWTVPDLLRGLLAQCCYVPLEQIVAGRLTQCAFPDLDHDCEHDVFRDVFAMWTTGQFNPEEPEPSLDDELDLPPLPRKRVPRPLEPTRLYFWPEDELRAMSTEKLRKLAVHGWGKRKAAKMKREGLIRRLSTPHPKNRSEGAHVAVPYD